MFFSKFSEKYWRSNLNLSIIILLFPASIYLFKVNNRNGAKMCKFEKKLRKSLRALKRGINKFLQLFKTQHISTHYYEPFVKKLRQNSNFDFQGTEPSISTKNQKIVLIKRKNDKLEN